MRRDGLHMNLKGFVATAGVALTLAACTTQPAAPVVAQAPVAAPAPATAPAEAKLAEAKPVLMVPAGTLNRKLIAAGFKATAVGNQIYYCRQEAVIGTGFKKKICLNEAQLRDQELNSKGMQDRMLQ